MILLAVLFFICNAAFAQDRLYIVQGSDESLAQVTLASGDVDSHVLDLGLWCNEIVVHGTRLFVANSGDNTLQEIDAELNMTVRVIPVPGGVNPWSVAMLGPDTIAVTCWVTHNVVMLRYDDGQQIGNLEMPTGPEGIIALEDRFIVCETGIDFPDYANGYVRVYDRFNWNLLDSLQVGMNAQSAAIDPQGRLHVVCTGDYINVPGTIHVVNLATMTTDTVLQVGGTPNTVSFGGGYAFVAAGGFGDAGYVYRYRLSDLTILNDANTPIVTGSGATDVEALSDGTFYVSCMQTDEIRYHAASGGVITAYPVSDGPGYMTLYPAGTNFSPNELPLAQEFSLVNAYPNPFNSTVFLQFDGQIHRLGQVLIFNELGQKVAELAVGPGTKRITWDGKGSAGQYLPSGTYIASFAKTAMKVVLIK